MSPDPHLVRALADRLHEATAPVVVGQEEALDVTLCALLVGGHVLLEGPPGVAKTLLARTLAAALGLDFGRVQMTPDLLPADVVGTSTLRGGELVFRPGPVFCGLLLADEINRTPPKTQAALLEAMQERQVTADGETRALPDPFLVVATQNPIEQEGTYPLPEAQLDRFLAKVDVGYPDEDAERDLVRRGRDGLAPAALADVRAVASPQDLVAAREAAQAVRVAPEVGDYAVGIVRATRTLPAVELGASPRAAVHLVAAAQGAAALSGRDFATPDDVAGLAVPVLAHRLVLRPEAEMERVRPADAIATALQAVPVPR